MQTVEIQNQFVAVEQALAVYSAMVERVPMKLQNVWIQRFVLANLQNRAAPLIIEIEDSAHYSINLSTIAGVENLAGVLSLQLARSLWIRARSGQRPVVILEQPLRFRPVDVLSPGAFSLFAPVQMHLGKPVRVSESHFGPNR